MARRITHKQRKFADEYLKHGNGTEAALAVYDVPQSKPNMAAVIASQNLIKPVIQNYLEAALPDELLATKHKEGLNATYNDEWNEGEIDYNVRARYLDMAYKIRGSYSAEKSFGLSVSLTAKDLQDTITKDIARFSGSTKPKEGSAS